MIVALIPQLVHIYGRFIIQWLVIWLGPMHFQRLAYHRQFIFFKSKRMSMLKTDFCEKRNFLFVYFSSTEYTYITAFHLPTFHLPTFHLPTFHLLTLYLPKFKPLQTFCQPTFHQHTFCQPIFHLHTFCQPTLHLHTWVCL
jgi:hypothetical protein